MKFTERICAKNNTHAPYVVGGLCEEVVRMVISLVVQTIKQTGVATKEILAKARRNGQSNKSLWNKGRTSIHGQALYVRPAEQTARTSIVRAVLRRVAPYKGLHPLRRLRVYSDLYHFGHHHRKNLSGIEYGRGTERMKSAHPTKESTPAHRPHHRGAPGGGFGI